MTGTAFLASAVSSSQMCLGQRLLTVVDVDGIMNGEALRSLEDGTVIARRVALI